MMSQSDDTRMLDSSMSSWRAFKEPRLAGQGMEISEVESVYLRLPSELDTTLHCLTRASSTNFISNVPVIELFSFLSLSLSSLPSLLRLRLFFYVGLFYKRF